MKLQNGFAVFDFFELCLFDFLTDADEYAFASVGFENTVGKPRFHDRAHQGGIKGRRGRRSFGFHLRIEEWGSPIPAANGLELIQRRQGESHFYGLGTGRRMRGECLD